MSILCLLTTACSSKDSTKYGSVEGTVTRMNAPVADATVTFIPERGPAAFAVTDVNGHYLVSTRTRGVAVGKVRVAVTIAGQEDESSPQLAPELSKQPTTPEEAAAYLKKAGEMSQSMTSKNKGQKPAKSLIPKKFGSVETSNLSLTVNANETNKFDIPLIE